MSNIFIIHTHWSNRGDEAANRALVDEIFRIRPGTKITVQLAMEGTAGTEALAKSGAQVLTHRFPRSWNFIELFFMFLSKGHITFSCDGKDFVKAMKNADIVVHAPGGPSIGDIYSNAEFAYLCRILLALRLKKPVFIYAPSIGPFKSKARNLLRKYILKRTCCVTLRESISAEYFKELLPKKKCLVTLDSAFQNDIDEKYSKDVMEQDAELCAFLNKYDRVIGITITDLQWNPKYAGNLEISKNIRNVFTKFVDYLNSKGYGVIFIPQLFGAMNDRDYMGTFSSANTFLLSDKYDCYFQQYLISKLYAVVGMRYHSNIFSCKMGTPFISVSYEQKMKGFMDAQKLESYCIDLLDLSYENLIERFALLVSDYDNYRKSLVDRKNLLKEKAGKTTRLLLEYLDKRAFYSK